MATFDEIWFTNLSLVLFGAVQNDMNFVNLKDLEKVGIGLLTSVSTQP